MKTRAYLALAAAGSLWGTGFLFGKIALTALSVPHMIMYRLTFAACGFVPIVLMRSPRLRPKDWSTVFIAGVLGGPVLFLIQFEGLARTTVSHASLMVGTAPILLGIAAAVFAHERLDARRWLLLVTSTVGALLIVFDTPRADAAQGPTMTGDLLVVTSVFAGVSWILLCKRLIATYPPSAITAVVMITGTILLDAWVLMTSGAPSTHVSARVWLALAAQGLLATTTASLLWNWGVARVPAAEAGVFVNLEPVLGTLLGVSILGETLGWTSLAGGALIIGAAVGMTKLAM